MTWKKRQEKQIIAEDKFREWCERNNISWAKSGIEQLKQDKSFLERIHKLKDSTSVRLRFFPDFIIAGKECYLIEVKNSSSIEKTAYDVYMELSVQLGYNVGIVILKDSTLLFCNIEDLKIVVKTDIEKHLIKCPIINSIWLAPRQYSKEWTEENYLEWKKAVGGSGTTYGYIDFENTNFKKLL